MLVLHQVGKVDEARRALGDGADGLIAQGVEAGGHLVGVESALDFLPRALEVARGRPVLVAGGIHDRVTASAALQGRPDTAVDLGPLYAGECARYIDSVVPAAVATIALDPSG